MAVTPSPFAIDIPDADLDDLRVRLTRTRLADDFANETWAYGVERSWLADLLEYWRDGFDWRAVEADMNRFDHFRTDVDGTRVHYLRVAGTGPRPLPLVLTHGWPWTFWDFRKVIEPLADPGRFGGDPADAFDVVVPSLPGYGFSSPLRHAVDPARIADLWVALMRDVLGYGRFAAQGGDWGAAVTAHLGHAHADDLVGVHLSMPWLIEARATRFTAADFAPDETAAYERMRSKRRLIDSHLRVHTRDPQTLAYALNDSPAGLAAWIAQKRRDWSECGGVVERRFSHDDLLTTISLYWFTQTFHTSARLYADTFRSPTRLAHDRTPAIEAPTAMALFPEDVVVVPRAAAAGNANLVRWTEMPRGGHFAPMEEPELLVDDVRAFFRDLR